MGNVYQFCLGIMGFVPFTIILISFINVHSIAFLQFDNLC